MKHDEGMKLNKLRAAGKLCILTNPWADDSFDDRCVKRRGHRDRCRDRYGVLFDPRKGLCHAGKHGLDFKGQQCDLCPNTRAVGLRRADSPSTIAERVAQVVPGSVWRHHEGRVYVVRDLAILKGEIIVTYQSRENGSNVHARTLSEFVGDAKLPLDQHGFVTRLSMPVRTGYIPRFTRIADP